MNKKMLPNKKTNAKSDFGVLAGHGFLYSNGRNKVADHIFFTHLKFTPIIVINSNFTDLFSIMKILAPSHPKAYKHIFYCHYIFQGGAFRRQNLR